MAQLTEKSEIFFIYETQYSQPNGDPFTGEQRYDEETKKALVSDVRIKRFIRDFLEEKGYPILVSEKVVGGKSSMKEILKKLSADKFKDEKDVEKIMKAHIDIRLFGGISTLKDSEAGGLKNAHTQITGPVQFALLNPSLNSIDLRPHQNTSVLLSKEENTQGAIATTSNVPYALLLIRGWVSPISAKYSGVSQTDLDIMLRALWDSIDKINTRSKQGTPLLLIQVVYNEDKSKVYGLDRKIKITAENGKKQESLRSFDELTLDLSDFISATIDEEGGNENEEQNQKTIDDQKTTIETASQNNEGNSKPKGKVKEVRIYTEIDAIKGFFMDDDKLKSKVHFIKFPEYNPNPTKEKNEGTDIKN